MIPFNDLDFDTELTFQHQVRQSSKMMHKFNDQLKKFQIKQSRNWKQDKVKNYSLYGKGFDS